MPLRPSVAGLVLGGFHRTAKILAENRSLSVVERAELLIRVRPYMKLTPQKLARAMLAGTLLEPLHRAGLLASGFTIEPGRKINGAGISGTTDAWAGPPIDGPAEFKSPRRIEWSRDLPGWLLQVGAYKLGSGSPEGPVLLSVISRERLAHWICVIDIDQHVLDGVHMAIDIWNEKIADVPVEDLDDAQQDFFTPWAERCKPLVESVSCVEIDAIDERLLQIGEEVKP